MSNFGTTDIHSLLAEIRRLRSNLSEYTNADRQALLGKVESAIMQLLSNFSDLHDSILIVATKVDEMKADRPLKEIDNSYQRMVLNKVEILKNLVKKNHEVDKDESYFSVDLIKIEGIEKDIVEKHSVTQSQMEMLNEIFKRHSNRK